MVGREVRRRGGPTVVAGDLNDVAWSYTTRLFRRISRLLDPRRGRGMVNTFHARIPFLRFPLDHVFHSRHFLLEELRRLPAFGSDHFAIYARLALHEVAPRVHESPEPTGEERELAQRKIEKAVEE